MGYWNTTSRGAIARINFGNEEIGGNTLSCYFIIYKKVKQPFEVIRTYDAESNKMAIVSRSSLKTSFDFENLFLVPTQIQFNIYDGNSFLKNFIFDSSDYEKDFYVYQTKNDEIIFSGKVSQLTLKFNSENNTISFTAISSSDRLNNTNLFNDTSEVFNDNNVNEPANPLLNIDSTQYAMTSSGEGSEKTYSFTNNYIKVVDLIRDIYSYAGITDVIITQNWLFRAPYTVSGGYTFGMIYVKLSYYFIEDNFETLADVLKHIAKTFGCYTGIINFDSAFFEILLQKTLYANPFDSDNTFSYQESYELEKLDFIKVTDQYTGIERRYYQPNREATTNKKNKSIVIDIPQLFYPTDIGFISITTIYDSKISSQYLPILEFIAKYWFMIRGDFDKCKVHYFKFPNIDRKFIDGVYYNNKSYQIIDLEINLANNESTIKAVKTI